MKILFSLILFFSFYTSVAQTNQKMSQPKDTIEFRGSFIGDSLVKLLYYRAATAEDTNVFAIDYLGRAYKISKSKLISWVDLSGYVPTSRTVNGHALSSNVTVSASDVGLSNVNNTSDVNKPVSTAQQTALDLKANISDLPCVRTDSLVRIGCTNVIQGTVARRINSVTIGGYDTTSNDSNSTIVGFRNKGISVFSTGDNVPYGMRAAQLFGFANKGNGVGVGYKTFTGTSESVAIGPKCYAGGNATIAIGDAVASMRTNSPGLNIVMGDVDTVHNYVNSCIQCGATHITTDFTTCIGCLGLYASDSTAGSITKRSHSLIFGGYYNSQNSADFNQNQGWFNNFQFGPDYTEFPHDSVYVRWAQSVSRQDVGYAYTLNKPGQAVMFEVPGGSGNAYGKGMYWTVSDTTISGLDTQKTRHTAIGIGGNGNFTTYFLDNYNSEPASYTSLSKISKGFADGQYGTLSQQNTNTFAIATNTSNIAANTSAIAGKQSTITTGTTAQYFDGTLGLKTFLTDVKAVGDTAYLRKNALVDTVHNLPYFINTPTGAGNFVRQAFFGYSPTQGICINRYNSTGIAIGADTGTTNQSATNYAIYISKDKSNTRMSSLGSVNLDIAGVSKLMVQQSGRITIGTVSDDGSTTLQVNGSVSIAAIGGAGMLKSDATNHPTLATAGTDYPTILNATLSSGTVTISDAAITSNAKICGAMYKTESGTIGTSFSYTYTAGVGYTITSSNILDNSVITYMLQR